MNILVSYQKKTWKDLKKELRAQFFLKNVDLLQGNCGNLDTWEPSEITLNSSRSLCWTFETCQKKIKHSAERLKSWARTKLYEQKVQDLAFAIAAAERLLDYSSNQGSQKNSVSTPKGLEQICWYNVAWTVEDIAFSMGIDHEIKLVPGAKHQQRMSIEWLS